MCITYGGDSCPLCQALWPVWSGRATLITVPFGQAYNCIGQGWFDAKHEVDGDAKDSATLL